MARVFALLSLLCAAFAINEQDLENWLYSPSGLDMSRSTAHDMAYKQAPILTQSGVTLDALKSLKETLYSTSLLDYSKSELQAQLILFAEQHVSPDSLKAMYGVLYSTSIVDMSKRDAKVATLDLVRSFAEVDQVKTLYNVLSTRTSLSKSDRQKYTVMFAKCGADPDTLANAYSSSRNILTAGAAAVSANLNGLVKRFAKDGKAYTASEFQSYYSSQWMTEWLAAPQEKRVAPDGQEYTAGEFREFFGTSWVSRYSGAAPSTQLRIAEDGVTYNQQEFFDYYKPSWQQKWNDAPVVLCKECRPQVADTLVV